MGLLLMFTYYFKSLQTFVDGVVSGNKMLWKITVSGAYVTLYPTFLTNYTFLFDSGKYGYISRFFIEHSSAHGGNPLVELYPSFPHVHVVLLCQQGIVSELIELLEFISEHNQPNKKLIDSNLIPKCIEAYQYYLSTASLDERKDIANNLLMRWVAPFINGSSSTFGQSQDSSSSSQLLPTMVEVPCSEKVGLAVIGLLKNSTQDSLETLRKESREFFSLISNATKPKKKEAVLEIMELMLISSTTSFSLTVRENPVLGYGCLIGSFFATLLLASVLNEVVLGFKEAYVVFTVIFVTVLFLPSLAKEAHTIISKCVTKNSGDTFNPKLTEIMNNNRRLTMFDAVNEFVDNPGDKTTLSKNGISC